MTAASLTAANDIMQDFNSLQVSWHVVVPGGMWLVPGGLTIVLNSFTLPSCSCSLDVTIPSISQLQEPAPCSRDIITLVRRPALTQLRLSAREVSACGRQ
jgi:hypothetical protein